MLYKTVNKYLERRDLMPPKKKYSRKQIVETAFKLAKDNGLESLTARKVADELGSSVAPIYVSFDDIKDLKKAVAQKAFNISREMSKEEVTGDKFLDIGIASLRFAKQYSKLFQELVLKKNDYMEDYDQELGDGIIEEMSDDLKLSDLTEEELRMILLKMRIFQLGLSVMVANDLLPEDFDEKAQIELLESMGSDVITATRIKGEEK